MLKEFEKLEGISLMDDTGVNETDLLIAVYKFTSWADKHKDKPLVQFFKGGNITYKTIRALALIGLKHVVSEYSTIMKESTNDKKNKKSTANKLSKS